MDANMVGHHAGCWKTSPSEHRKLTADHANYGIDMHRRYVPWSENLLWGMVVPENHRQGRLLASEVRVTYTNGGLGGSHDTLRQSMK